MPVNHTQKGPPWGVSSCADAVCWGQEREQNAVGKLGIAWGCPVSTVQGLVAGLKSAPHMGWEFMWMKQVVFYQGWEFMSTIGKRVVGPPTAMFAHCLGSRQAPQFLRGALFKTGLKQE